jgi:type II secretory pathway pseudopilin PulG
MIRNTRRQIGFSLLESLLVMWLLSIASLGLAYGTIGAFRQVDRVKRNQLAMQLATSRLEQLSAANPLSLGTGSTTETGVVLKNVSFSRVTTVAVNADQSRSVSVVVTGEQAVFGGRATMSTTFSLWGSN